MRTIYTLAACLGLIAAGCGQDDKEPGEVGGPCIGGELCFEPLTCASNLCVDLSEGGGESGGGEGEVPGEGGNGEGVNDDGGGDNDEGDDDGSNDGSNDGADGPIDDGTEVPEIYCSHDDEGELCICGHNADYGPPGGPCSTSTVDGPNRCCASEGWPAWGGCTCWHVSCRQISTDTCYCGLGGVDPEDDPVSSCSTSTGVCCSDGDTCSCHENLEQCVFEDEVEVSSCSVSNLDCGADSDQVDACA